MERRRLLVLLVAIAAVGATLGFWFLPPQQVTVLMNYSPWLDGKTAVVTMDSQLVGKVAVPNSQSCDMSIGCVGTLGEVWLARGLHKVRVTVNDTTMLDQGFIVDGRTYALVEVGNGNAGFRVSGEPFGFD